jgi:hypothetical protein
LSLKGETTLWVAQGKYGLCTFIFWTLVIDFVITFFLVRSSGAEISMCSEQIFGSDIDFISWDYGMTDGNYPERLLHYGYRGGLNPGRPAFLGVHVGGRSLKARVQRLQQLEEMGMAVFIGAEASMSAMRVAVPDSFGKSEEEISKMPEYVRNLKCSEKIEDGEPYCRAEKFSKNICSPRGKQTSWHPGL